MKKMLIVYYSWSNGNTKRIAELLQGEMQADIARIETAVPYTGTYEEVVNQGQEEVQRGYEPPIKELGLSLDAYDVIAVGTPTWWYTMAPAVKTFIHSQPWGGRTVIPFMTHGGWPGHVIKDMKKACAGATFIHPMEIQFDSTGGDQLQTPEQDIAVWIEKIKKL